MNQLGTIDGAMLVPTVLMEDPILHTDETPFCSDMSCPCHQYGLGYVEEHLVAPVREGKMSVKQAMNLYRGKPLNLMK